MFPQIRLAFIAAKIASEHGHKILHANNPDLLTRDLGSAMKKQKDILSNPRTGMIMTAYDIVPILLEVKILSAVAAWQLGVETKGRSNIQVLEDIIAASEARQADKTPADKNPSDKYCKDIKATLEWTRKLFSHPEIQDVLGMEMTEIERPKNIKGVPKFVLQIAGRSQDELVRVAEFLRQAKDLQFDDKPASDDKPSTASKDKPKGPKDG